MTAFRRLCRATVTSTRAGRVAVQRDLAVYVYQALPGFVGSDHVLIEVLTGSAGASPPTNIQRVAFDFRVRN
jgi:hypothetical protein